MIKEIITDTEFLAKKCLPYDGGSEWILNDLLDTAYHLKEKCASLAANQVGYLSRVVVVRVDEEFFVLINPKIIFTGGGTNWLPETCLSRPNCKPVYKTRHKNISDPVPKVILKSMVKIYNGVD